MVEKKIKEQAIEGLIGWMEDLEEASLEELREIRNELGHDTEKDEAEFLKILRKEYEKLQIDFRKEPPDIETDAGSNVKPFLGYVSDETGLPPSKIEQEIGFSTEFLIQVTENAEVVNDPVRKKIVDRTLLKFPQLDRNRVLGSLRQSSKRIAAARDTSYSDKQASFEEILESSGMSKKEKAFWLELNRGKNESS
jgi:hypothetical protein